MTEQGKRPDYSQYVHEYVNILGSTRYAVGKWNPRDDSYSRPYDAREPHGRLGRIMICTFLTSLDSYPTRRQALRRARTLWGKK